MSDSLGIKESEKSFIKKWSVIRKKGKLRYVFTRGLFYGIILFIIWLIVTLIEINMSEFKQAIYTQDYMIRRSITWFLVYLITGLVIARGSWKAKEEKYKYLT